MLQSGIWLGSGMSCISRLSPRLGQVLGDDESLGLGRGSWAAGLGGESWARMVVRKLVPDNITHGYDVAFAVKDVGPCCPFLYFYMLVDLVDDGVE